MRGWVKLVILAIAVVVVFVVIKKNKKEAASFFKKASVVQYTTNDNGLYGVTMDGRIVCYPANKKKSYFLKHAEVAFCDMANQLMIKKNGNVYYGVTEKEEGELLGTIANAVSAVKFRNGVAVLTKTGGLYITYIDSDDERIAILEKTEPYMEDWIKVNDFGSVDEFIPLSSIANNFFVFDHTRQLYYASTEQKPMELSGGVPGERYFIYDNDAFYILNQNGELYQKEDSGFGLKGVIFYEQIEEFKNIEKVRIYKRHGIALSRETHFIYGEKNGLL